MWDKLQHEMYWNESYQSEWEFFINDKLQHEMYWNNYGYDLIAYEDKDKLQHEMYWNLFLTVHTLFLSKINYNMRCIETKYYWNNGRWGFW